MPTHLDHDASAWSARCISASTLIGSFPLRDYYHFITEPRIKKKKKDETQGNSYLSIFDIIEHLHCYLVFSYENVLDRVNWI